MWNVAVVMPLSTAQSTVRGTHRGSSPSRPNTKLPLIMMPRSSSRRMTRAIVAAEILLLAGALRGCAARAFSKPTNRLRNPAAAAYSIVSSRRIESTVAAPWKTRPMPRMPVNSSRAKRPLAEQVIVEKIQMPARQAIDLGERRHRRAACRTTAPAFEERVLVAERAVVRAAARHDDRVGHEVAMPLNQIAADRRHVLERAQRDDVARLRRAGRRGRAGIAERCLRPGRERSCRRAARLHRAAR